MWRAGVLIVVACGHPAPPAPLSERGASHWRPPPPEDAPASPAAPPAPLLAALDAKTFTCMTPAPRLTPDALTVALSGEGPWLTSVVACALGGLGFVTVQPAPAPLDVQLAVTKLVATRLGVECNLAITVRSGGVVRTHTSGGATVAAAVDAAGAAATDCLEALAENLIQRLDPTLASQTSGWLPWPPLTGTSSPAP